MLYTNGTVQHAGVVLGIGGVAGHVHRFLAQDGYGYCYRAVVTQNFSVVTAACLLVRRQCFDEVNGLEAEHLKVALNDVDFCIKLTQAGYINVYTPLALLFHHESISRGKDDTPEKMAIFEYEFGYMKKKWGTLLTCDPAYNKNLSLESENFLFN